MVKIHPDLCNGCGECISVCHESCIKLADKKSVINHDFCSTCGQCAAICPEKAIWWDDNIPEPFNASLLPGKEQLSELLLERRTNRHLKSDKPPRKLIEEVINMGAAAPTHDFNMRCIAVDDESLIDLIDAELLKKIRILYNAFFRPKIIAWLLKIMPKYMNNEYLKAKPKLEKALKMNRAYTLRPPVIVYVAGKKGAPLTLESAQYAAYNMDLYARTLGLGCRNLTGNNMFVNGSKKIRKAIGLKNNEQAYAAIAIGYPGKTFRNKVIGRKFTTTWNG
jgi:ferredoxin